LKRILLAGSLIAAACGCLAFTTTPATAAKPAATPTASPTPLPMPTASPEPPSVAIPRLEARLKANPNDRDAMLGLAQQFLVIGHPEAAVGLTQHLLQIGTKTAQVYYLDASAQGSLNNVNAAISDLEAASNLEPTNLSVLASLASLYVKANRFPDAERVANRAVTFNKTDPQAYSTLGSVYAAEQKWDDARKEFEQAYQIDPKDVSPLMQEAQTWVAQNTIPNALTVIDRALAVDPKNVQVLLFRADLFAKRNDIAASASAFDDAAAAATSDGDKASVMVRKALMYAAARQTSQAEATFDSAIQKYPAVASLHVAYGEYFMGQHDQRRAEQQFQAALGVDKNDVNALFDLAQLKESQGRISDAVTYLKQLAAVAPSAQTFGLLGQGYIQLHDYNHAKDACSHSFAIDRTPDSLACIAGSDFSLKNYKEAAQIFGIIDAQARPYMDHNPQMLYMMGYSYAHNNDKTKALDAYKRLLKMLKPGTSQYKQIQTQIASLNTTAKPGKKTKRT
jgi:tetratricopeptide (TPR) repeat protein